MKRVLLALLIASWVCSGALQAATTQVQKHCGVAGVTMHQITGANWPEPAPPCHYRFILEGVSVPFPAQEIAPRQPNGLFGPPDTMFTIPATARPGEYRVRVELHDDPPPGGLLASAQIPFFVVRTNTMVFQQLPDGATLLGNNPAVFGGDQRIFVGKITPAGPNRETVRVKATLNFPCEDITVHFQSTDIDDPTASGNPLDSTPDNGATAGNDNRGAPQAGTLDSATATTDATGAARVTLTLPRQPGDNVKVAASVKPAFLATVVLDGVKLVGNGTELKPTSGPNFPDDGRATKALVVWRKLHIESDSMGLSAGNNMTGTITSASVVGGQNRLVVNNVLELNRFHNGKLHINGVPHPGLIASNATNNFRVGLPAVSVGFLCNLLGLFCPSYLAYDDDDFNSNDGANPDGDTGENITASPLNFLQNNDDNQCLDGSCNIYSTAFIRPVFDLAGNNSNVPFLANEAGFGVLLLPTYQFANVGSEENPLFWTVYLLGAYQFTTARDDDPDSERSVLGVVDAISGQGANVFLEAGRECRLRATCNPILNAWLEAGTGAHEVAHLLAARHCSDPDINSCATATGAPDLMSRFRAGAVAGFNQDNLDRIRDTMAP